MHLPTKFLLVCLLAFHFGSLVRGEDGQEKSFANENCALTPPAGWQPLDGIKQSDIFAAFCDADRSRIVMLMAHGRGHPTMEISDVWIAAFDRGVTKAGGHERLSGKIVQMAGYSAYERRGTSSAKNKSRSTLMIAMPTGDGIYILEGLSSAGDASEDAEIRQSLNTFRFLHPPGPPQSVAYRLGYRMGQLGFAAVVLGLVIWLIVWAVTRNRAKLAALPSGPYPYPAGSFSPSPPPPPAPPPLPPSFQ